MKKLIPAAVVAAMLAVPAVSFAQSTQGLTHAQVQGELAALEQAGYSPTSNQDDYPANLQAAEQRVDAEHGMTSGYGPVAAGTSATGAPVAPSSDPSFTRIYGN